MRARIISDPAILGGTPVFRGTRIPLDHIVTLLRKATPMSELAEDYPSLSEGDWAFAREQVALAPDIPTSAEIKPIRLGRKSRAA